MLTFRALSDPDSCAPHQCQDRPGHPRRFSHRHWLRRLQLVRKWIGVCGTMNSLLIPLRPLPATNTRTSFCSTAAASFQGIHLVRLAEMLWPMASIFCPPLFRAFVAPSSRITPAKKTSEPPSPLRQRGGGNISALDPLNVIHEIHDLVRSHQIGSDQYNLKYKILSFSLRKRGLSCDSCLYHQQMDCLIIADGKGARQVSTGGLTRESELRL